MDIDKVCALIDDLHDLNMDYPTSSIIAKTRISAAWAKIGPTLKEDLDDKIYLYLSIEMNEANPDYAQKRVVRTFGAVINIFNMLMQKKGSCELSSEEEMILSECEGIDRRLQEIKAKSMSTERLEMIRNNLDREGLLAGAKITLECVKNELNARQNTK